MSDRRRVAQSIATVVAFILLGKAFAAAREVALAANYGTSEVVDAYLMAGTLVNWPLSVWVSSLTVILVPFLVRARERMEPDTNQVVWELYIASLTLGALFVLAALVALPSAISLLVPDERVQAQQSLRDMLPLVVASLLFGFLSAVLAVQLIASERHINTLLEGIPALVVTLAILAFPSFGIGPLVWGTVAGTIVYLATLVMMQPSVTPAALSFSSPFWSSFPKTFFMVAGGQAVLSSVTLIDQVIVAELGPGSVAELGYANRVLSLGLAIGATAISRATLPMFSASRAQLGEGASADAWFWVRCFFALGFVGLAIGWALAPVVVSLLFERGAFTATDTAAVSEVLRFGLLQLPFYFSALVCTQMLAAQNRYTKLLQVSLLMTAVKLLANIVLVGYLGVSGVQGASAIMYIVALAFLSSAVFRKASVV